ncbi:MAG: hypothetical protein LBT26_08460 [Clostridiales Family XIII bacterium]|jgi:hypothetical protein|nr:hypothetical protein [Clostridiales Family XIII bacterium]
MSILLSHWHCILPAAAIVAGMLLMNRKRPDKQEERPKTAERPLNEKIQ